MAAAANNPDFAKRAGISQSVASEFHDADQGALNMATGGKSWVGNWGSTSNKAFGLYDLMAPGAYSTKKVSKKERKRRKRAGSLQEKGHWGDEILTGIKNPDKRRNLVRAGWYADTPAVTRKGVQGAKGKKGKKYATSLNKDTVFYPPQEVGAAGQPGQEYLSRLRNMVGGQAYVPAVDPRQSYISTGMYEGGLAPMNDIIQRGFAPSLHMQGGGEVWTPYGPGQDYGDIPADTLKFLNQEFKGDSIMSNMMRKLQAKARVQYGYDQPAAPTVTTVPTPTSLGPRGGRRGRRGGGRRGRNGEGGGPGPGVTPPGGGGPPGVEEPPVTVAPPILPRDPRAGRDTEYSEQLRAHRARVASSLAVPPGGYAEGGHVENYQEGGEVRPGHAEGPNPYPEGSARYSYWESRKHVDPAPPPEVVDAPPAEDLSWLDRILGRGEEYKGRSERELEEMDQAYGGYIDAPGYQFGGLAQAGFRGPPRGGVPPQMRGMPPSRGGRVPWRGAPPARAMPGQRGGGGLMPGQMPGTGLPRGLQRKLRGRGMGPVGQPGNVQRPMDPNPMLGGMGGPPAGKPMPWRGAPPPRIMPGGPGGMRGGFPPGKGPRMQVPPSRGMPPQGGEGPGIPGGPRVPPNMRGFLQKQRMMNRPPANVGGGANRVGQQDQQGGLARALQRGTGRPPMSRRGGFGRAR